MEKLIEVVNEHQDKPHVRGKMDCQLMVLKVYEPEKYEQFVGRYTTIMGGVRKCRKLFGYSSLMEFLEDSEDYEEIPSRFERMGDIIVYFNRHDAFLSLGSVWFGVTDSEHFGAVNKSNRESHQFKVYRRK